MALTAAAAAAVAAAAAAAGVHEDQEPRAKFMVVLGSATGLQMLGSGAWLSAPSSSCFKAVKRPLEGLQKPFE